MDLISPGRNASAAGSEWMARKQAIGRWGERLAEEYLSARGCTLIQRNVRTPYGEIDLVMRGEGELLIFVEVKTRTSSNYGKPEEAVTAQKRIHMLQSAEAYLLEHAEYQGDWRVDVISIFQPGNGRPEIVWFENALT
jgi:putative endonuclease